MWRRNLQTARARTLRSKTQTNGFLRSVRDDSSQYRKRAIDRLNHNTNGFRQFNLCQTGTFASTSSNHYALNSSGLQKPGLGFQRYPVNRVVFGERRDHGRNNTVEIVE